MSKNKYIVSKYISIVWPLGLFPIAQGTFTSIFSAIFGLWINIKFGSDITIILAILIGALGLITTKIYLKKNIKKDPSEVVIDEFSGQLIASSAAGVSPLNNVIAFILFRLFDILKPGIIKKAESLSGSLGVMMDDWIAGIFAATILLLINLFIDFDYNLFYL